ncbi:unnamed protein product, partial [Meganyctiphanes norvegica]
MSDDNPLHPFIYWAQTETKITLKIDLRNVQSPIVDLREKSLEFSAVGVGAQGEKKYSASLDFYGYIDTDTSQYRVLDRHVEFSLIKINSEFWERLLEDPRKHAWLKIDFDKWVHQEDLSEEARDIMEDYPDLFDKIKGEEMGWATKRESMKKVYLFLYNLWQFVGFLYIISVMITRYMKDGPDSMEGTYENVWKMLAMCLVTQFLEVFHCMVGYTKGNVVEAAMQTTMRAVIFFALILSEERMHTKPVVFYLFCVWSTIELVSFVPFILNIDVSLLNWYTRTVWNIVCQMELIVDFMINLSFIWSTSSLKRYYVGFPSFLYSGVQNVLCYLLYISPPFFSSCKCNSLNQMFRCNRLQAKHPSFQCHPVIYGDVSGLLSCAYCQHRRTVKGSKYRKQ